MAVIKIVPMPGAEGQKGEDGLVGPQGPQGEAGPQGPAGADALWSYNGEWLSNATYAQGDLVTYEGQLYYATGITTLGVTPDLETNFDLIASKGEPGLDGAEGPQGDPGEQGAPGPAGADALWNFVGEYDNGADYYPGDVVTFAGGTYYRIGEPNPGYFPTDPTYWTTIALPGATGPQGEQGLQGEQGPQGIQGEPGVSGALDDLTDVTITGTPTNQQLLVFDSATSQWKNADPISSTGIAYKSGIPASKTSTGISGQISIDAVNGVMYVCVSANNWQKVSLNSATFSNPGGFA